MSNEGLLVEIVDLGRQCDLFGNSIGLCEDIFLSQDGCVRITGGGTLAGAKRVLEKEGIPYWSSLLSADGDLAWLTVPEERLSDALEVLRDSDFQCAPNYLR